MQKSSGGLKRKSSVGGRRWSNKSREGILRAGRTARGRSESRDMGMTLEWDWSAGQEVNKRCDENGRTR
eukprot:14050497-Alexandrium_andersonii.AAC.1